MKDDNDDTASSEQRATAAVNKLAQEAREIVDKLAGLADETARRAIPATALFAHKTVESVAANAAPAAAWVDENAARLNATQEKLLKDTRELIRENPLASIGLALVVGVLLGRALR